MEFFEHRVAHTNAIANRLPIDVLTLDGNDLSGSVSQNLCGRTGDGFFDLKELTVDCDVIACECCNCDVNRTQESV